jgi:predicted DNA-binding antitoxin AbrB/MazE fold protein
MTIQAIFRHGVFEPLEPVNLSEEQRVHINIVPETKPTLEAWFDETQATHARFLREHGPLPDSTPGISADRMR